MNINYRNINCENVNSENINYENIRKWYSVGTTHGSNPHTLTVITSSGQHEVKSSDDGFRK